MSESIVAMNNGDYTFQIKKLPYQAQFSCINDIETLEKK